MRLCRVELRQPPTHLVQAHQPGPIQEVTCGIIRDVRVNDPYARKTAHPSKIVQIHRGAGENRRSDEEKRRPRDQRWSRFAWSESGQLRAPQGNVGWPRCGQIEALTFEVVQERVLCIVFELDRISRSR
jgi:hypothetical protein